ncbi:GNAT family N-acetyltransferase [Nocardiopsis gilva YIM 90087]|uniref:Mycothiol acetyltransferase n=1 Tax=Nocardiopsis gilva YIM 90087 TaxID=1235441 RepID=A0A223S1Z7_9ACTN|nr:mycothiol synthase [Nocardiopsis gilva]ASU82144.1 GNAT family N-acetyltransferase [Nocardiopsis gilva YIM 90087]
MSFVDITGQLETDEAEAVIALAEAAQEHDGVAPLAEQTLLRVRHGAEAGTTRFHLIFEETGSRPASLAGFAFAERTPGEPDSAEVVVLPKWRRRGHGSTLLRSLVEDAGPDGLRVWAHGRLEGAVALARSFGWEQVRGLLKMRLRLRGGETPEPSEQVLPEPVLSDEVAERVVIRTFQAGTDEPAWLKANAAAFADHPEQGGVTLDDLRQREAEEWFDPEGFFVAEETATGAIAGFHWTKTHADGAGLTDGEPVGEVYVVGIDPAWQGTGLGRALTLVGLRYLRDRGLPWVLLYVDEENRAAVRLYESLGFTLWDADVMYAAP